MELVVSVLTYLRTHPSLLVVGVLVFGLFYLLSLLFYGTKRGPNPFLRKLQPPRPLVTDTKARDAVLKQGFTPGRVPDALDAVVVGSGIGGLGAAALMAKAGRRVLVLEQHDQAGGCCHTYHEQGFEFDVGIHYIGQMRSNTLPKVIIDQVTEGQLVWDDLEDDFDMVALGPPGQQKLYTIHGGGAEAWKARLLEQFPDEEQALTKYMQLLKAVKKSSFGLVLLKMLNRRVARFLVRTRLIHVFCGYFTYSSRTLQSVLEEVTENKDLRAVLAYSFGDYGVVPTKSSFALHASLTNHYQDGASYPRGGASEVAFHIIPVVERAGGKVLVRARVSKLLTDTQGAVTGVRVERAGGHVDIHAPLVISDAGAINTFHRLLPREVAVTSDIYKLLGRQIDSSVGCMQLFVGLNGTKEELGLKAQQSWSYTGNDLTSLVEDYMSQSADDAVSSEIPLLFVSFPSTKDTTHNDRYPGKTTCTVITLASWAWFSQWEEERVKKRGDDYEAIKKRLGRRMWEQTLRMYPQLEDKVEYFEVGTPLSNNYYLSAPKGELYGLEHTTQRLGSPEIVSTLRPETGIKGLLLTGQDVMTAGFTPSLIGSLMCASSALNRNLLFDVVKIQKQLEKSQ